ncbi:MAG TPA: glycoside hydrolase family 9 protein [Polyangiaceae bacterium]|nr:glycoside hydrolase family 9 protein [Polyangiaceae bacterium]
MTPRTLAAPAPRVPRFAARFAALCLGGSLLALAPRASAADTDVRVNSIGYLPLRAKLASVVGAASSFSVVRDADGAVVLSGTPSAPVNDADTGESVASADFSALTDPGTYHLEVDGVGRSVSFAIDPDVYANAFVTTMLGFYGWRCGTAVAFDYAGTHYGYPACHLGDAHTDPLGTVGTRDGTGGWHDAGDYGKYTVNAALAAGTLLRAFEDYGPVLAPVALQIPETGGALPDFLAEVRWELSWLLKMQYSPTDGRVSHKLVEPTHPGFIMPEDDTAARSFVPYGTAATADFVAVLAQAARVYRPYDAAFADQCLAAARVSYDYLQANPANVAADETGFIGTQYSSTDSDDRLWAAAELWATTGDAAALADVEARIGALTSSVVDTDFDWGNLKNLGLYTYLQATQSGRDDALVTRVSQALTAAADTLVTTHRTGGYGRALDSYYWGVNGSLARTCMLLGLAYRIAPNPDYLDTCSDQIAFLFGRNSYDRSMVTGLGVNPPLHIHHRPSASDGIDPPYPGLLVGGSWVYRALTSTPPIAACTLPAGACWEDVQDNYEVNEVAINWNAALVYALASFVGGGPQVPSHAITNGAAGGGNNTAGSGPSAAGAPSGGSTSNGGSAGDASATPKRHTTKSGCGCRAAGSEGEHGAWWGLGVLALALGRLRASRSRRRDSAARRIFARTRG